MKRKRNAVFAALTLSVLAAVALGAGKPDPASVDAAYQQSFDKWKSELTEDLKQEWLPLAGLFWLKPGENSFGTDPKNAIVFPKGPAQAGSFTLEGKNVTAKFESSANATIAGKAVTTVELQPDTSGNATVVEIGSFAVSRDRARRAYRHPRKGRGERCGAPVSRSGILSSRPVLSRDRHMAALRWQADS